MQCLLLVTLIGYIFLVSSFSQCIIRSNCRAVSPIGIRRPEANYSAIKHLPCRKRNKENVQMVLLQPIKYVFAFTGGIAFSTWINRKVNKRQRALAKIQSPVSPYLFLETANAHIGTASLKSAVDLGIFDKIGALTRNKIPQTVTRIAESCGCSEKGMRILLDFLTAKGFLIKSATSDLSFTYELTQSSAKYLDQTSPSYIADSINWLASSEFRNSLWNNINESIVSRPPANLSDAQLLKYASSMGNKARSVASKVSTAILSGGGKRDLIVDVGSGHGAVGVSLATQHFNDELTHSTSKLINVDRAIVLPIAAAIASKAGISNDRYTQIKGNPATLNWGTTSADAVLFFDYLQTLRDEETVTLLRKAKGTLSQNGCVYIIETIPNETRNSGEGVLSALPLLVLSGGCTRSFKEFRSLCIRAGFESVELVTLPNSIHSLIVARTGPLMEMKVAKEKLEERAKITKATNGIILGKEAKKAAREDFPSPEETTWSYPMSLGDFFGLVERMVVSSITKNPFE